jgi:hypothetical protein
MRLTPRLLAVTLSAAAAAALAVSCATPARSGPMGFFVTSAGPGDGANLGGLAGADAHCQKLAAAAGAGNRTWHAYLSTGFIPPGTAAVHARERIGKGPWFNAKGVMIARDLEDLHANGVTKETALTEKGAMVNGRTDKPVTHDILTGSRPDGTAYSSFPNQPDMTCGEWTKNGPTGSAMTGHHDRSGPSADPWATSWNSSHGTAGCGKDDLPKTGGAGLFYCFAAD